MIRLTIISVCLVACCVGCTLTRKQADQIKTEAGDVASFFGIPRPIAEGVTALAIAAVANVHGRRRGRKNERDANRCGDKPAPPLPVGGAMTTSGP